MALGSTLLGDAYVDIMGETSKLERSLARAQGMVGSFVSNAGKAITVGIGAALAGVAGAGIASVWAWAKEEQSVKDLESSIRMLGGSVEELVPKYEKAMAQIQQNTRIGDDATRSAMAYAASMGAPVDRLDELAIAAAGLAERLGMNMRTAMMYLTRGLKSGQFSLLTRYGLVIDQTKTKAEQFNDVLKFGMTGFGKASEMADTLTGRLTQLQNNFGDLMEDLGKKISERFQLKEIVDEISKRMYKVVQVFDTVLKQIKPGEFSLEKIGQGFENIVIKIISIIELLPRIAKMIGDMWESGDMMTAIGAVFKESAKLFVKVLMEGLKGLIEIFKGLGEVISGAIKIGIMQIPGIGGVYRRDYARRKAAEMVEATGWKEPAKGKTFITRAEADEMDAWQQQVEFQTEKLLREGGIEKQIVESAIQGIKNGVDASKDAILKSGDVIAGYWEEYRKEIADAVSSGKPGEDVGAILQSIIEKWKARFAAASTTESMPEIGDKGGWEIGGGTGDSGESFQKTGFAAWWDKMQEATKMTEAEKEQIKAQQAIEKNTRQLLAYFKPISHNGSDLTLWGNVLY